MFARQALYHLSHSISHAFLTQGLASYLPGLALNFDSLISASRVAMIIDVSHQYPAQKLFFT
jgi:hypothetical protein